MLQSGNNRRHCNQRLNHLHPHHRNNNKPSSNNNQRAKCQGSSNPSNRRPSTRTLTIATCIPMHLPDWAPCRSRTGRQLALQCPHSTLQSILPQHTRQPACRSVSSLNSVWTTHRGRHRLLHQPRVIPDSFQLQDLLLNFLHPPCQPNLH